MKKTINNIDLKSSLKSTFVFGLYNDYRKFAKEPFTNIKDSNDYFDDNHHIDPPPPSGSNVQLPKKFKFTKTLVVGERSLDRIGVELEAQM